MGTGEDRYAADELALDFGDDGARFAPLTIEEALVLEHEVLGLSLREHPMALYRDDLRRRGILDNASLTIAPTVRRCGSLGWWWCTSHRQRRTASTSSRWRTKPGF